MAKKKKDDLDVDAIVAAAKKLPKPSKEKIDSYIIERKITDLIKKNLKKFKFDFKGHCHGSEAYYRRELTRGFGLMFVSYDEDDTRRKSTTEQLKKLLVAMKAGKYIRKPLPVSIGVSLGECHVCDQSIGLTFNGKTFRAGTECPYPGGMPEYSIDLPIPSGKMVVANDLRDLFEDEYAETDLRPNSRGWGFNVNTDMGCRQVFETYGELGMAHGFVGNTCPCMYRVDKNTLTLSMVKHDEESYDTIEEEKPGERVGGVCTDLWWYSVMDYNDYVERTGNKPDKWCDVVDVKPGMYRVTHRTHTFNRDANVTDHYAVFKWIRKLTKKDVKKKREPLVTTFEDTLKANIIFSHHKTKGSVLDRLFFTIGAGYKWQNGCIIQHMNPRKLLDNIENSHFEVPEDLETRMQDVDMPSIYPISEGYSPISNVPDDVRDDWLAAAFDALDMAIAIDPDYVCNTGHKNSDQVKLAKKIRKKLEKRFKNRLRR